MHDEPYNAGTDDARLDLGLEKRAWASALLSGARNLAPKALGHAGKGISKAWNAATGAPGRAIAPISNKLRPVGKAIEGHTARGVGSVLGQPGADLSRKLMRKVPAQMAKDTAMFAGIGGGLEGGMGALFAEDGQRGDAFLHGLGSGALTGAATGAVTGFTGGLAKNIRRSSLHEAAKRQGLSGMSAHRAAKQQLDRGFRGSARDLVSGKGTLGRAGSAQNMLGGAGQFGAEVVAPFALLPASLGGGNPFATPDEPPAPYSAENPYRYRDAQPFYPEMKTGSAVPEDLTWKDPARYGVTLGGGALLGIPTGMATDLLKEKPWYPKGAKGSFASRATQTAATAAGLTGGHLLGNHLLPPDPPPPAVDPGVEEKLEQIDFDKLMRYYKKREAEQA